MLCKYAIGGRGLLSKINGSFRVMPLVEAEVSFVVKVKEIRMKRELIIKMFELKLNTGSTYKYNYNV